MAAVVVAALNAQKRKISGKGQEGSDDLLGMDANGDGMVSDSEIIRVLGDVSLRVDIIHERLVLEQDMADMCMKLPCFFLVFFCFLSAMYQMVPAASIAKAHRHIKTHFNLGSVSSIGDHASIYSFMADFEHANMELQATSYRYWCETRYTWLSWDAHLQMPATRCASPRLYAIGLGDAAYSWTALREAGDAPADAPSAGDHNRLLEEACDGGSCDGRVLGSPARNASAVGSRRMQHALQERGASSFDDGSHAALTEASTIEEQPCEDDDAALKLAADNDQATCQAMAAAACNSKLGQMFCAATCGYCGPFTYEHLRKYDKPQVTLLPSVIYQTRFQTKECHGYAERYNGQRYNPVLKALPPLDGRRNGHVLKCVDRTRPFEGSFAHSLRCPEGMSGGQCESGPDFPILRDTPSIDFDGKKIYAKFMNDPATTLDQMREVGWLDLQTDAVTVSTLVYTEGSEIFTSLKVNFVFDAAGNVDASYKLGTYRDMTAGVADQFVVCCVLVLLGSLLALIFTIVGIAKNPLKCGGMQAYELLCRSVMFFFVLYLVISWSLQTLMAEEYEELLNVMLEFGGGSSEEFQRMLQDFFDVIEHLIGETQWLMRIRITAYVIMYMQFSMLILMFSAHPRMAVLTSTISKCFQNMLHFLILFFSLFLNLAFIAHWMLGEHIPAFESFSTTTESMARMLFGEFIYAGGVEKLDAQFSAMYWIFAFTFMLVVFFTLLNFFLAIVVDAYVAVKEELGEAKTHASFVSDCLDVVTSASKYKQLGWPSRERLLVFFSDGVHELRVSEGKDFEGQKSFVDLLESAGEEEQTTRMVPDLLLQEFPEEFTSNEDVAAFINHYYRKCTLVIGKRRKDEDIGGRPVSSASPPKNPRSPPVAWPEAEAEDSGKGAFPVAPEASNLAKIAPEAPPANNGWADMAPKPVAQRSEAPQPNMSDLNNGLQSFGVSAPPRPVALAPNQRTRVFKIYADVDIKIRQSPRIDSTTSGEKVHVNEAFEVSAVREVGPQRFLQLADGRGWVFTNHPDDLRELVREETREDARPGTLT